MLARLANLARYALAGGVAVLFVSCAGVSYPSWYVQSPQDSKYLYGVGEGANLQAAKLEALNDIAAQISVSMESSLNIQQSQISSGESQDFTSTIASQIGVRVESIELDNLEYPHIEESGDRVFVQARIEKAKVIAKFNANIESLAMRAREILKEVESSKCEAMLPSSRNKLLYLYQQIDSQAKKIRALNGKVAQENLIKNLANVIAISPSAYYRSFASGGNADAYRRIDSALLSEYGKFFTIKSKDSKIFYIENRYMIDEGGAHLVTLNVSIKDCNDNALFDMQIKSNERNIQDATERLKVQLYKKLKSWAQGENL